MAQFLIDVIKAFNSMSSQVWAFVLILLGLVGMVAACLCHESTLAVTALLTTGGNMVVGGIALFQHQSGADKPGTTPPPATDVTPIPKEVK